MGLDMYLSAGKLYEKAYWRKSNAIHRWFVVNCQDGVDDCGLYFVTRDQIEELSGLCQRVKNQPKLAPTLLPTQSGFFFGDTEYGEAYFSDIDTTIEQLTKTLDDIDEDWVITYQSSW